MGSEMCIRDRHQGDQKLFSETEAAQKPFSSNFSAPCFQGKKRPFGGSRVDLAGATDLRRTLAHLNPMGNPARQPAKGEKHREHVNWETQGFVDDSTIEINIWIKFSFFEKIIFKRNLFQLFGYVQQWICLLYTSPSPRDPKTSRMPSSA